MNQEREWLHQKHSVILFLHHTFPAPPQLTLPFTYSQRGVYRVKDLLVQILVTMKIRVWFMGVVSPPTCHRHFLILAFYRQSIYSELCTFVIIYTYYYFIWGQVKSCFIFSLSLSLLIYLLLLPSHIYTQLCVLSL